MGKSLSPVSREAVETYETTLQVFEGLFEEIKDLSKKKPEMVANKFKVSQVNRVLKDLKSFLQEEPAGKYLDLIEDETLPQLSDLVIIMSQYNSALQQFYAAHHGYLDGNYRWMFDDEYEDEYYEEE
jgi:hypothetical protein